MSEPATVTVEVAAKSGPGAGPAGAYCTVPKMKRGAKLRAVKQGLTAAGCKPGKVKRKYSEKVDRGPQQGASVKHGATSG
jgi:hypothetical protein